MLKEAKRLIVNWSVEWCYSVSMYDAKLLKSLFNCFFLILDKFDQHIVCIMTFFSQFVVCSSFVVF